MVEKYPLADCDNCPYKENTAFVPTQYPSMKPKVIILGEAPGQQEAKTGIPFTGPSGELLNNVLKHHGINRDEAIITNACLCRPAGPTEKPPKAALAACATRLHSEIQSSGVDTIIAVGNTGAQAVLSDRGSITTLRVGPPKPYDLDPAIRVIPTWHPAYCLRSPDAFPSFVADVGKFNQREAKVWEEPQVKIYDEPGMALLALQALIDNTDRAVIDIEVGIEKDFNYAHPEDFQMLCVGIAYAKKRTVVFGETAMADQNVRDLMRKYFSGIKLIAHNGKFDLRGLSPVVGLHKLWFDTMLAHYALDERPGGHGLKVLSVELLGAPKYDDELKTYVPRGGNYADVPRDVLYKYNAMDVACTWELYELFTEQMDERARRVHDFAIQAANELIHLEINGIKFDHGYNKELSEEYLGEIDTRVQGIRDIVKFEMNPNSVPQVTNYFHSQGLRVQTTGKDFLEEVRPRIGGPVGEFIDRLLEYRRVSKLYGTYIKGLAKRTTYDKVYTTYLLHGTTSGRLASRNPNMQNIVRDKRIRNQFIVEHEDNVLLQLDYKQAEGRVIATLAGDEYLASIFNDPTRDIFDELTNQIYGVIEDKAKKKEQRVKIKSVFYGLSYGREARSIGNELGISTVEAQELLSNFKALIPATVAWQQKISRTVLSGDDLVTPFGRKRSFYLITEENKKDVLNEALSFMPQSTASDICLTALIKLRPLLAGLATVRLTIHDAIVVECHKDNLEIVKEIMRREMIAAGDAFSTFCKFAVDASVGRSLGEL
jgi:uracil-DNA glycosylase family 4